MIWRCLKRAMDGFVESSIFMKINDGYSFRNSIEILERLGVMPVLTFDKDGLSIIRGNETRNSEPSVLVNVKIKSEKLTKYSFESSTNTVTIPLNATCLKKAATNIGRSHDLTLSKEPGKKLLEITCADGNKTSGVYGMVPMEDVIETKYELSDSTNIKRICVIETKKFSSACTSCSSVGPGSLVIHAFPGRLRIQGRSTKGEVTYKIDLGEPPSPDDKEIENYTVSIKTIKAMVKFQNLSLNGTVACYAEKDKPLKLELDVGHYGTMTIHIKSPIV